MNRLKIVYTICSGTSCGGDDCPLSRGNRDDSFGCNEYSRDNAVSEKEFMRVIRNISKRFLESCSEEKKSTLSSLLPHTKIF